MADDKKYAIGFDLGGTKMLSAVVNRDNEILEKSKIKTKAQDGVETVYSRIVKNIHQVLEHNNLSKEDIGGIGIAVPGPIDPMEGVILDTPNLAFKNFPIKKKLEADVGIPVFLENDVNAGLYGEFIAGAAKGYNHVVGVFPGTGIGGALILNGGLYRGAGGNAGEFGHIIINTDGPLCGCGRWGCVEAHASKSAMNRETMVLASKGALTGCLGEFGTDIKKYKSSFYAAAVEENNQDVIRIIKRSARFLGVAIANAVNLLNPELIVLGGGLVEKLGEMYVSEVEASMHEHAMPDLVDKVEIHEASLGDDAVFYGAANLVWDELFLLRKK